MGQHTDIQWCDSTVNPTSGCDGCELFVKPPAKLTGEALNAWLRDQPCYASQVHRNRLAKSFPHNYAASFSEVRTIPGRLMKCLAWSDLRGKRRQDKPWLNGMPRLIFISDMSDALSEAVSFEYLLEEVIKPVIAWQAKGHVGMWLTKRPERMVGFARWLLGEHRITWPHNLWVGASVTTQATANKRIPWLMWMKAGGETTTFVSFEPARAEVNFERIEDMSPVDCSAEWLEHIDLVIVGGESGPRAKAFDSNIARSVISQCEGTNAVPFVKQMGSRWAKARNTGRDRKTQALADSHGGDWTFWPDDLRVRRMPEVRHA